jgi:hypothetical protein
MYTEYITADDYTALLDRPSDHRCREMEAEIME